MGWDGMGCCYVVLQKKKKSSYPLYPSLLNKGPGAQKSISGEHARKCEQKRQSLQGMSGKKEHAGKCEKKRVLRVKIGLVSKSAKL